jgi:hypothetical protein
MPESFEFGCRLRKVKTGEVHLELFLLLFRRLFEVLDLFLDGIEELVLRLHKYCPVTFYLRLD